MARKAKRLVDRKDSRQAMVPGIKIPEIVSIIGCGGVGANVAQTLAGTGVRAVLLFDFDNLEAHNRERIFIPEKFVGKRKDEALAEFMTSIHPETTWTAVGPFTEETKGMLSGTVFCATDNLPSQMLAQEVCETRKLKFIRVGADGNHVTVIEDLKGLWGEEGPGYTLPSWKAPVVLAAAKAVVNAFLEDSKPLTADVRFIRDGNHKEDDNGDQK